MLPTKLYYYFKPAVPRRLQIFLRRKMVLRQLKKYKSIWPIDPASAAISKTWSGWPGNKRFALVLTHDVDTERGQRNCSQLMQIDEDYGFKSSFNFVPERYDVSKNIRQKLVDHGFEVGVHGLHHDGKLYASIKTFRRRAKRINRYLKEWRAVGFRSPAMHHVLEWLHDLDIKYDASTFDTDPFEPDSNGAGTIFPFWVDGNNGREGFVELPYTLPQDFTLFVIMKETNIDIWKQKTEWIAAHGGMLLLNTHPDYMKFTKGKLGIEEYPAMYYESFIKYLRDTFADEYWHVLPKEMAQFWRNR